MSDENKRLHLQMIQAVITRMASNSFLLKGWSVTIISALFALLAGSKLDIHQVTFISSIPLFVFWGLDAYFLRQERLYRKLYKQVCVKNESQIDFSLDVSGFSDTKNSIFKVFVSVTLFVFYMGIILLVSIINLLQ